MSAALGRRLDWEGCTHVRDLGGLPAAGGRETRRGAMVRAADLGRLTDAGWRAAEDYGIRTVVDLRNGFELVADAAARPAGIATLHVPLDAMEDAEFWDAWGSGPRIGTPLFYRPFLERFPERVAAVVSAIAGAAPGGVAFHCVRGRDRSGLVSALLLSLAGVAPEHITADYALSLASEEDDRVLAEYLAGQGTTAEQSLLELVGALDVEAYLRDAGVAGDDVAALRARFVGEISDQAS